MTLRLRWLGRVPYREAWALQRALYVGSPDDHLLLLEHPHVYTLGVRADTRHILREPAEVGADFVRVDRGGDVTYHGPGQLVGYPIVSLPAKGGGTRTGMADTVAYVRSVEQLIIDTLADVGLPNAGRLREYPGVWVDPESSDPRKLCAIGVRLNRGRTMHGFGLNVAPDIAFFGHIVPCGIPDKRVTSLAEEGVHVSMREVVEAVSARAAALWGADRGIDVERSHVVWRHAPEDLSAFSRGEARVVAVSTGPTRGRERAPAPRDEGVAVRLKGRLAQAGVTGGLQISQRKPEWLRAELKTGTEFHHLEHTMRDLGLVTVCEEAGCPNIYECWADGTATFMINGARCTRACGFCLVDTRHPLAPDADEPTRVAEAVARMGLRFAVVTAVARDDLADGGAAGFAATIRAIRARTPGVSVEVLIPDCKGAPDALEVVFRERPDVLDHNLET